VASLYIEFEDSDFDSDIEYLDTGETDFAGGGFPGGAFEGNAFADDALAGGGLPNDALADTGPGGGRPPDGAPEAAAAGIDGPEEVVGVAPRRNPPRLPWAQVPHRRRRILVGAVVAAGISAGIGDALAAQASQHAADRPTLDLIDASYTANTDGDGFDMLLDLGNGGSSTATITSVTVDQPGLELLYPGSAAAVAAHQQIEIVLGGRFDCSGLTGDAPTIEVTLRTAHGSAADLEFRVPSSAALPDDWLADRAGFCDLAAQESGFQ
jgi:hypothetical protein